MSAPNHSRLEDKVIEAFVMYLARKLYPGLQVIEWPDKDNTRTPDIDAIAETSGVRIAIEHTSADSLPDQRLHNDRFMEAIGCLEEELKDELIVDYESPFRSVPYQPVSPGMEFEIGYEAGFFMTFRSFPTTILCIILEWREFLSRSLYRSVILPRMVYFSRAV
jgi:hypothetical protein